jgi:hypothetical protein
MRQMGTQKVWNLGAQTGARAAYGKKRAEKTGGKGVTLSNTAYKAIWLGINDNTQAAPVHGIVSPGRQGRWLWFRR